MEAVARAVIGVNLEDRAYRSGWEDGRCGQLQSFVQNASLAALSELDRLSYYRGHKEGRRVREMLRLDGSST
jgi:hypothetical protein